MKNHLQELQQLFDETEKMFEVFGWFKKKPAAQPQVQQQTYLQKHQQGIESGSECAPGKSNNRFTSELGSNEATFYSIKKGKTVPTGSVKNIKPFLDNAKISKQTLRCYNLEKDPLRIAWLFDGEFDADVLGWDSKKRKVIFQGTWKKGLFGGINYEPPSKKPAINPMESKFFILKQGIEIGPYTAAQMVKLMKNNTVNGETVIRSEESAEYESVGKNKTLKFLFKSAVNNAQPTQAPNAGRNLGQRLP
jgi:hypothetical protein